MSSRKFQAMKITRIMDVKIATMKGAIKGFRTLLPSSFFLAYAVLRAVKAAGDMQVYQISKMREWPK